MASAPTKLAWIALEVLPLVGFILFAKTFLKMQGSFTGAGVPRLVWKSTPPPDTSLPPLTVSADPSNPVDLSKTTPQDWPQFLGPDRSNRAADPGLSSDWTTHPPKELWRQPIGGVGLIRSR